MKEEKDQKAKDQYVYVRGEDGSQYVCRLADLKRPDQLTDEEKEKCMVPPGDA